MTADRDGLIAELAAAAVAWARADRAYLVACEALNAPWGGDATNEELAAVCREVDAADDRLYAAARALEAKEA